MKSVCFSAHLTGDVLIHHCVKENFYRHSPTSEVVEIV